MSLSRSFKWIAGLLLAPVVLAVLFIAFFGWNWMREPIERMTLEQTGRELAISGDIKLRFGWPLAEFTTGAVRFANPAWAREKQMLVADAVEIDIDLPQLLRHKIIFPEVRLVRPVVFLEHGSNGRKNWLLDIKQQDEATLPHIDRLILDQGMLGYDDAAQQTGIRAQLSTSSTAAGAGVSFTAQGQYRGLPLQASGNGGPVLGLRDETMPYPLAVEFTAGPTSVKAEGTITSLLKFSAADMHLALHGGSLAQLYPLLGIVLPETHTYATEGHLLHSGNTWRYENFTGLVGSSDLVGTLQIDTGGKRPAMTGDLVSRLLDIADLGPLIGARTGIANAEPARVLPDIPFKIDRWGSLDAEVNLRAKTILRDKALPLGDLVTHLSLRDSVLKLDPLDFGMAGGHLNGMISLDGREDPIQAHAQIKAANIHPAKLFPTVEPISNNLGQLNGKIDLAGKGNAVRQMLANANGKVVLVVASGEISKLMLEKISLHLWEILALNLTGDQRVRLHCGVADFGVKDGSMRVSTLLFDTEVTTIIGSGNIDLRQENLDLTLHQETKRTSPLALSSPIHVRGSLAKPVVEVDKQRVATRALGAIALGIVNPLLAMLPLIDTGPGKDRDCGRLVPDAQTLQHLDNRKSDRMHKEQGVHQGSD